MLPTLLLWACAGPSDDSGGPAPGGDGGTPCEVAVQTLAPADGELDVALGRRVQVTLSGPDPSAEVHLAGPDGPLGGRTWREAGDTVAWFEADAALPPAATLAVEARTCAGTVTSTFQTLTPGPAVEDPAGRAYLVDVGGASWVSPPGLGLMLGVVLPTELLIGARPGDAGTLQWVAGASSDGKTQDTCKPTVVLPTASFTGNPWFQVGPADLSITVRETGLDLRGMKLAGQLVDDGAALADGVLAVEADMAQVLPVLVDLIQMDDAAAFCEKIAGFGIPCTACSDGSGDTCVQLYAEALRAQALAAPFEEIAQADCHPGCAGSWSNPDCDTSGW